MNENPAGPDAPAPEAAPTPTPESASTPVPETVSTETREAVSTETREAVSTETPEAASTETPVAPRRRMRPARIVAGVAVGALLVAVVGGVGFTAVAVDGADRDAGAPVWRFPKKSADDGEPKEAAAGAKSGLAGLLVPYETDPDADGFTRGPDIDEFGSDSRFSGRQATELRKQSIRDLPRSQRLRLEKQIDKQHIQGMAMRSYVSPSDSLDHNGKVFTVDIVLSQMDKKTVRDLATFQNEFLDALEIFRKGPKIEGHRNAQCFLPPKDAEEKLDLMVCSAYKGDVLVSATAYGVKPLNTKGVAVFLREQLDRIAEPGEAV
ncbi:hypothetical protein [Streptomyces sp. DSM 40484]|uniref:hypothetical protein n=1 Tax=Streptomyces kroppenstedtii TaxID=3051181 RepID=UPI0028D5F0C8|nr:hypothetical protein [Streptomyces sp. DSM 40484]